MIAVYNITGASMWDYTSVTNSVKIYVLFLIRIT
jgi:hypothetical protein